MAIQDGTLESSDNGQNLPVIPGHTVVPAVSGAVAPANSIPVNINGTNYHASPNDTMISDLTRQDATHNLATYINAKTPSSSSSLQLQQNANTALSSATGVDNGAVITPAQTKSINGLVNLYSGKGLTISSDDISALMKADPSLSVSAAASQAAALASQKNTFDSAKTATEDAKRAQAQQYSDELAANDAGFAVARNKLTTDRQNAISSATASLAALNSSGGISSNAGQFLSHINDQYDMAESALALQGTQARAALDAGNTKAYEAINSNMQNTIATVNNNIANIIASAQGQSVAAAQQAETNKKDAITQGNAALANLPQPQMFTAMGSDFSALTAEQKATVNGTEAFSLLKKGGMTDQQAFNAVQQAASSSFKQQAANTAAQNANTAVQRAQIATLTAQANLADKQAVSIDSNRVATAKDGQSFLDAVHNAVAGGKYDKTKIASVLGSIADNLEAGDTYNAKKEVVNFALSGGSAQDQRMYSTLAGLPAIMDKITTAIAALPKDQQPGLLNGTYQDIAAKFGQNPSPELRTLAAEMGHVQKNYITGVYGMRAASLQGDSIFNNLFPSGKDASSLSFSVAKGLVNTAKDTIDAQVKSKIGDSSFSSIFGDSTFSGGSTTGKTVASPTFTFAGTQIQAGVPFHTSDGKTLILDSSGKPSLYTK